MEHPNAYLTLDTTLSSCAVIDGVILPVHYNIRLKILNHSTDPHTVGVAHQRIKMMIEDILPYSVFVEYEDEVGAIAYATDSKVVDFEGPPHDFAVARALFWKLNAILEDEMRVENVQISSNISSGMTCHYTGFIDEFALEVFDADGDIDWSGELAEYNLDQPWWHRSDTSTSNIMILSDDDELVLCNQNPTWEEYGLLWDQPAEPKNGTVVQINSFKPTVISGGKKDD